MERALTQDQKETIIAIKERNFDEFWKKRCGNEDYISKKEKLSILSFLAVETFDQTDWKHFRETMLRVMDYRITTKGIKFKKEKTLSYNQLLDCYVSAFTCMRMIFPDKDV